MIFIPVRRLWFLSSHIRSSRSCLHKYLFIYKVIVKAFDLKVFGNIRTNYSVT